MSCRVYCTKEKPYWYDRVHSDMFFSLSSPTIYTLNLHSLDVAAVRDEPQSYRRDRQHSWPTLALCTVSATLYSILKYYRCWQTHHLHTVKGRTTRVIQIADAGVYVVFWTMSAVFIPRGGRSSIWNLSSSPVWSLKYAIRFIDSIKL